MISILICVSLALNEQTMFKIDGHILWKYSQEKDAEHQRQEEKRKKDEQIHRKTAEEHMRTDKALRQLANMGLTDTTTNTSLAITNGWKVPASALDWKHKLGNGSYGSVYEDEEAAAVVRKFFSFLLPCPQ